MQLLENQSLEKTDENLFLKLLLSILILDKIKKKYILTQGCKQFLDELIEDFKMGNSEKNPNKKMERQTTSFQLPSCSITMRF